MEILKRISQVRKGQVPFDGKPEEAVFIGSGILAESLIQTANFAGEAVHVLAAFCDKPVRSEFCDVFGMLKIQNLVPRLGVSTAILCVPHREAAKYADILAEAGITHIWNWSGAALPPKETVEVLDDEPPCD